MPNGGLTYEAARLKTWICEKALPFWAETARDPEGGFYEYLNLDLTPATDAIRRVRVQARQVYVYALATDLGWYDGRGVAKDAFSFMADKGYRPDGRPGFVHLLNADYTVNNARRDLYDHAFYLLACSYGQKIGCAPEIPAIYPALTDFVLSAFHSESGGWLETPDGDLPRRQNPHMHFFETTMAWMDISDSTLWRDMAGIVFDLFERHFFDPEHAVIREFFNHDWSLVSGPAAETTEPGHMAEWIWLLWQYETRTGTDTSAYAAALYQNLNTGRDYFLNDEETIHGEIRRETRRLWCQTELVKAHLAQGERGVDGARDMAAAAMKGLWETYLHPDGYWTDQINACGAPIATTIPTSTFYHIMGLAAEADRVAARLPST